MTRLIRTFARDLKDAKSNGGDWDIGVSSPPDCYPGIITGRLQENDGLSKQWWRRGLFSLSPPPLSVLTLTAALGLTTWVSCS